MSSSSSNKNCRNCLSGDVVITGNGSFAPFFLKRVYGFDAKTLGESIEITIGNIQNKKIIGFIFSILKRNSPFNKLFNYRGKLNLKIRVCKSCGFVGPDSYYPYEMLNGLYNDYRSDNYNKDRCVYEPTYKDIQHLVGKDSNEVEHRLNNVDYILEKYADTDKLKRVLDWGGGEGKFIPRKLSEKQVYILDVSNEPLINEEYIRINEVNENTKFDYVQLCHVLEHVSDPYQILKKILDSVDEGGLIYIEVPQDRSDTDIEKFKNHPHKMYHLIHEHLNLYSTDALLALGRTLGLETLYAQKVEIDLGWIKSNVVSALFKKR